MADTYFELSQSAGAASAGALAQPAPRASGHAAEERDRVRAEGAPARRAPIAYLPFPPTSAPHRDLLVLEQVAIRKGDRVCELGVGSGATAARLARLGPEEVVGFDVSAEAVDAVRDLERRYANLRLEVVDVTKPVEVAPFASSFDVVLSCDTLEHVRDPDAFFQTVARLLAPRGKCFVTFPNEPPETMHGITRFASAAELEAAARRAGLSDVEIGAARLTPGAASVIDVLGWRPLGLVRSAVATLRRARGEGEGTGEPAQRFEETSFFRHHRMWRRISPAVNLYWYVVLLLMGWRRPAFEIDWGFRRTPVEDCQIVLRGKKPQSGRPVR